MFLRQPTIQLINDMSYQTNQLMSCNFYLACQIRVVLEVPYISLSCPCKNEVAFKITIVLVINHY
jgi:hypothetical protein